jgi:hypothetical protein
MSRRGSLIALTLLIVLTFPGLALAKGRTVKITMDAVSGQHQRIEMNAPDVSQFHIWDGPGTFVNSVEELDGFIVDWRNGPQKQRAGSQRYRVSFYTGCRMDEDHCRTSVPRLSYVVIYEFDPNAGVGFVYLPGKGEEWYDVNTRSLLRGREGNWFVATTAWQKYVAPYIAKAER